MIKCWEIHYTEDVKRQGTQADLETESDRSPPWFGANATVGRYWKFTSNVNIVLPKTRIVF